ncbi:SCO family protein [Jiella avicenniae]|uniref:SCO family protein n=1 Tax=Jiella avicenniae TaxID=2907202 RepID=A0A9X1TB31_9HYPH|nr:SCO family protein [Jiella avicenniae]MCE7027733.1 SCO family protein [Jiella avicenniae]MCE7028775.1 SCO family protein [Jiella avicenniae]
MTARLEALVVVAAALAAAIPAARAHDAHRRDTGTEVQSQRLSQVPIPSLEARLVDTSGKATGLSELLGERSFILSFSYLDCPEQCPVSDLVMHKLALDLGGSPAMPSLVTLTLDPENDSHDRLAAHHADFGSPANWHWATGRPAEVHGLLRRLGVETGAPLAEHDVMFFVGSLGSGKMTPITGLAMPETLVEIARQYEPTGDADTP